MSDLLCVGIALIISIFLSNYSCLPRSVAVSNPEAKLSLKMKFTPLPSISLLASNGFSGSSQCEDCVTIVVIMFVYLIINLE